jgi:hypothetical protein
MFGEYGIVTGRTHSTSKEKAVKYLGGIHGKQVLVINGSPRQHRNSTLWQKKQPRSKIYRGK